MAKNSTNVYDLVFPSPPALQEIAAIAVTMQLWREKISKHRLNNTLSEISWEFNISSELNTVLPNLPSTILSIIEGYYENFQNSLTYGWFMDVANEFDDDIVCDFDGNIHYDRIARRVMLCEGISDIEKFRIACNYCLEDDVMRIWPRVSDSEYLNFNDDDFLLDSVSFDNFRDNSLLYYWVCRLRNQLHKIPLFGRDYENIDEHLIEILQPENWSSLEYFWNRLKVESRVENAALLQINGHIFCRYILVRLTEEELNALMARAGDGFMHALLNSTYNKCCGYTMDQEKNGALCFLAAWKYVKHKISSEGVMRVVEDIFEMQTYNVFSISNNEFFSHELWDNTAQHLKKSIILDNLLERFSFEKFDAACDRNHWLLLSVLKDTPFVTRSTFWHERWRVLLRGTKTTDLQQFMILCFKNVNDVNIFKENNLSKYENIWVNCSDFMNLSRWSDLDEFLNFCCLEKQTNSALRMKCLNDHLQFFDDINRIMDQTSEPRYFIKNIHSLSTFIDDTYHEVDLAADFKNRFLFAPRTIEILSRCVAWKEYEKVMEFVDIFVISEQAAVDFKERHFLPTLLNVLATRTVLYFEFEYDGFENFMRWCLGSDDKIAKFKSTVPVEDIVRSITRNEGDNSWGETRFIELYSHLGKFLEWCFSTPEEIAELKKKFDGFENYASK